MKTFEYFTYSCGCHDPVTEKLNGFGEEGWELVAILYAHFNIANYIFKREKEKK
jgi:hypothetical protein